MDQLIKLLIVDDEPELIEIVSARLAHLHFPIESAKNGKDAYDFIKKDQSIVAVLSDFNMPEMNGLECLKKVRADGIEIPFVFLTGFANPSNLTGALQLGAIEVLEKPFKSQALEDSVRRALKLGFLMRALQVEYAHLAERYIISPVHLDQFKKIQREIFGLRFQKISSSAEDQS